MNPNSCECGANRTKRSDTSRGGTSRNVSSTSRMAAVSINRTPMYIDDANINPVPYPQYIPTYFPPGQYGVPEQHQTFGSQIDYNLGWMPKDINLSDLIDQGHNVPLGYRKFENKGNTNEELSKSDPRYMLNSKLDDNSRNEQTSGKKQESLMEWFDRTVESELKNRRDTSSNAHSVIDPAVSGTSPNARSLNLSKGALEKLSEASASRIEIANEMKMQPTTELTDAVDKLAKAEAMCAFADAVKAAEAAADAAPPGLAEEAAVASARGFQTDVTTSSIVRESVSGATPVEVIGYVGVTKPRYPKKPNHS